MRSKIISKSFLVDFDAIIELCAGFRDYFEKHPDEEKCFPQCNEPREGQRGDCVVKSREMFIGKKTENFTKLLNIMSIELDAAYLEAEYYLTPCGEGDIYNYTNGLYSISFDFHIDPTAQIEICAISVSFPEDKEDEIISIIRELQNDSRYVVKRIHNGDFDKLYEEINRETFVEKSNNNIFTRAYSFFKKKSRIIFSSVIIIGIICAVLSFALSRYNTGVITKLTAKSSGDNIELKMTYFLPMGGYSVREVAEAEGEYFGNGIKEYDGDLGKYRIIIEFGDIKPHKALLKMADANRVFEIENTTASLKAKIVYPSDHGFALYIGSDTPISVENIDSNSIDGLFGTIKVPIAVEE